MDVTDEGQSSQGTDDGWIAVGAAADVPEGRAISVTVEAEDVLLYRRGEELFAIGNRCTHQGALLHRGPIKSMGSIVTVTCPAHGSMFSLSDGRVMRGPAMRPEAAYEARVRGEVVQVRAIERPQDPTRSSAT
jgi:nitrite reductase/ring-hydroxylating ferredoxin subunit